MDIKDCQRSHVCTHFTVMMIKINWQWMQSSGYFNPSCKISSNTVFWVQDGKRPCSPQGWRVGYWKAENKQNMGNCMEWSSFDTLIKFYAQRNFKELLQSISVASTSDRLPQSAITWTSTTPPFVYRFMYNSSILCFWSKWLNFSTLLSTASN